MQKGGENGNLIDLITFDCAIFDYGSSWKGTKMGLEVINISKIRENPVALRAVNRQDENYVGLVESIRTKGFLGAITVRAKVDLESKEQFYELVDGLHRFCAAKDAGLETIKVDVVDLNDDQTLEAQIMANIHKIETRPIEYSRQLLRILSRNPLMTEAELATKLGKSPQWISERLNLTKIENETIKNLVNEGKIGLANAYALAKLPAEEQADFTDRAMTLPPDEFVPQVQNRVKEIREAKRKGEDAAPQEFQPIAHVQKIKDIKDELTGLSVAKTLVTELKITDPVVAFQLALKWVLHLDPKSVEVQKADDDARRQARDEARKRRSEEKIVKDAEKKKIKAAEAAKEAEEAAAALAKITKA